MEDVNKFRTLTSNPSSIFFEPAEEIWDIIHGRDNNKSPGFDNITAAFLKEWIDIFTPTLTDIVNLTIFPGIYPEYLKVVKITPVYKSEEKSKLYLKNKITCLSVNMVLGKALELILPLMKL